MSFLASRRPKGFGAFAVIWSSQVFSILASGMSGFALTIWMYQRTQSATAMAAVQVFYIIPFLVMSFFAGPIVDRANRKLTMAISDVSAALGTCFILAAFAGDFMELWMVYAASALMGLGNSFQWPAFSATISLMIPKPQLGRVNGMMSLLDSGPAVLAPILAGILLPSLGIVGILVLDVVTFVVAVGSLLLVDIPQPAPSAEAAAKPKGGIIGDALSGFAWIFKRPSMLGLQLLILATNFFAGLGGAVFAPMVLGRSGGDSLVLGGVQTAAAIGGVLGGLLMSAWGGFKKRALGLVVGGALGGLAAGVAFGLGRGLWGWAIAAAVGSMTSPVAYGSNQALWQTKVPADMQGRVFSARRLIAWITFPLTPLIAGPLADFVLEPAMANPGAPLAAILGPVFGTGTGAGMAVLVSVSGLFVTLSSLTGWLVPAIRNAESLVPDAVVMAAPVEGSAGAMAGEPADGPEAAAQEDVTEEAAVVA